MKSFVKDSWMSTTRGQTNVYTAKGRVGMLEVEKNNLDGHCKIKVIRQVSRKVYAFVRALACAYECETKSITTEICNTNKVSTRSTTSANARWNHIRVEQ